MTLAAISESCWPACVEVGMGAKLVVGRLDDSQTALLPDEAHLAEGVTQARLRELRAGRTIARYAITALGGISESIQMAASGAPIWPDKYCGSLTHTNRYVAALIALSNEFSAVGVDIDDGRPLGGSVNGVAHADELELVCNLGNRGNSSPECLVFSIKEALFKCQCPLTDDALLEFLHVRLVPGKESGSIGIEVMDPNRRKLTQLARHLRVHVQVINGITAACVVSPRK